MPENKNQHFVPKYHLRRFGFSDGHVIRLLHLPSGRVIRGAPIKKQCSDAYFYGKDSLIDELLQDAERKEGIIVKNIVESQTLPRRDTMESHLLYRMAALFSSRTARAANSIAAKTDAVLAETVEILKRSDILPAPPEGVSLDDFKLRSHNDWNACQAVQSSMTGFIHLLDLNLKILRPPSGSEFITSDHPSVLINQALFGKVRPPHSATGFALRGLQVVLPIDPQICLFFYDEDVYRVGPKNAHTIVQLDAGNLELLNALQVLNGGDHLYFQDPRMETSVRKLVQRFSSLRSPISQPDKIPTSSGAYVVASNPEIPIPGNWSFCKVRPRRGIELTLSLRRPEFSRNVSKWQSTRVRGGLHITLEQFLSDPEMRRNLEHLSRSR